MGLRPTYMDETHLESMSFDGVGDHTGVPYASGRLVRQKCDIGICCFPPMRVKVTGLESEKRWVGYLSE
jgi:hypothetical protein